MVNLKKKIGLYSLATIFLGFGYLYFWAFTEHNLFYFDFPTKLSNHKETIEVQYIAWGCECANWLETKYTDVQSKNCIFIEPSNKNLSIPKSFMYFEQTLKLTGYFYIDKGLPKNYEITDEGKPDYAKVFKFEKIEVLKK